MDFKRCERCGTFFIAEDAVCYNCVPKDKLEISKLKNFFEENNCDGSVCSISSSTGITTKNLNRHLNTDTFNNVTLQKED